MPTFSKLSRAAVAATLFMPLAVAASTAGFAQDAQKAAPPTEAELKESEARKGCKVAICAAFHNRKPGDDVSCNVLKTWRKERINDMISKAKVSWPWGSVRCTADIKLKREILTKAMTEDKFEAQLDQHHVACDVEQEKGDPSKITFDFKPKVTFEKGKATKAALNWGKIEAPTLVKGAMWTATATDNTFNVLQSSIVKDINDFITVKCDEVKADWQGK